jgi:hypothetical protein
MQRSAPLGNRAVLARIARCKGAVTVADIARLLGQRPVWVQAQLAAHDLQETADGVSASDALFLLLWHVPQSEIEAALGRERRVLPDAVRTEVVTIALPVYLVRALERMAQDAATAGERLTASIEPYVTEQLLGLIDEETVERAIPGAGFALRFPHHRE